ncbi:hypothetical protein [Asticcacaulis sp. AC402]|uniref:hypothetical protein n=1 Tax=Asticcacaulis sp. AC402 TaxID=1282361 RepID=UPI0012DE604C|nr:hypothetical protein [Asticcacaulis sp. AC402]
MNYQSAIRQSVQHFSVKLRDKTKNWSEVLIPSKTRPRRNPTKCAALFDKIARQDKKLEQGFGSFRTHPALATKPYFGARFAKIL